MSGHYSDKGHRLAYLSRRGWLAERQHRWQLQSNNYWSSSERAENTDNAWNYNFNNSKFNWNNKTNNNYVRAVFAYRNDTVKALRVRENRKWKKENVKK